MKKTQTNFKCTEKSNCECTLCPYEITQKEANGVATTHFSYGKIKTKFNCNDDSVIYKFIIDNKHKKNTH